METIDEYIAQFSPEVRDVLERVRAVIRAVAPEAEERISYQMPTFRQGRNLIHFAACAGHLGIYPGGEAPAFFADKLRDYSWDKGTIRFPWNKPIPYDLIAEITRHRVEVETARSVRKSVRS
ncbi:MAG: DUF1801 domain-containing protein [Propionibacteriaceae bacterium]|jgi:uncharacterized protein YdhG (YjbR/CyaY superfamily)|nr:DUF1801 domain-containing protein [Propionibacteriaceae bacterium]